MFGFARRPARPALPPHVVVRLADRDLRVTLKPSSRATRFILRLGHGAADPVLTVPERARLADAEDFLERHRGWLSDRLARRPAGVAFTDGAVVPLRGVEHRIAHRPGQRGTVWVERAPEPEALPLLCVAGRPEHLARRLRDHFRRAARADLLPAVARHAERLGVPTPSRIRIKDTRSRWGSCTADGELAFSWRVILAPPQVLDYLAAHEVAHLRELNHSVRFWRLVRETCPDMDVGRRWLRLHGAGLHGYDAEP